MQQKRGQKVQPYSEETEKGLLGVLLLQNRSWETIESLVSANDFYYPKHSHIFTAIGRLHTKQQAVDMLTVIEALQTMQLIEQVGGESYIYTLADQAPATANVAEYAKIIRDKALLRALQDSAAKIVESIYHPEGKEPEELVQAAESQVFAISQMRTQDGGPVPLADILAKTTSMIDELYRTGEQVTGVPTGYTDLDKMTAGMQPADLLIVAGRPSMGKTVFGMNIAEYVAVACKKPVLVFSLEMPSEALVMRMLSSLGRVEQNKVRTGKLTDEDWPRMTSAIGMLAEAPMFIDDKPGISPSEMRTKARRLAREQGQLGLILVDYLQLMRVPELRDNRVQEISEISRSLKMIAKELNVPLIALSQLNRSLEQRTNRRPVMSDLRESGSIEQDADVIAFIYRDEVYNPDTLDKGVAEINIGKQRNGPTGVLKLAFNGQFTRFDNHISEVILHE